jgi:hypothetical protein
MSTQIAPRSRSAAVVAVLLLAAAGTSSARAQNVFDDFSSGNDNAWLRVDAPAIVFGTPSSYTVTGGGYRIGTPANALGRSAYSFRLDGIAVDSQISVDILNWNPDVGTAAAISARAFQNAAGNLQYYTLAFLSESITYPGRSNLGLYRFNGDGTSTLLTGNAPFTKVTAGQSLRMVMTLTGRNITGEIFDIATGTSLSSQNFKDNSSRAILGPGAPGLEVATFTPSGNEATYATFDNFRVVPGPGAASLIGVGGLLVARRRRSV